MNKSIAITILLALLVLALVGSGAAGYMSLSRELEVSNNRAQSADVQATALEQQIAELSETAQLCEERGREIATLQNKTAELQKEVAGLKSKATTTNTITWELPAGGAQQGQVILGA